MNNIVNLYLDKYGVRDDENEEKRVRGLIKKMHEKGTVFSDFPFDYMVENEQLDLLHYIMTLLPERQIMANMKKIDVDRNYMNFVYQSEKNKIETKYILENQLEGYSPINLNNEFFYSRRMIRTPIINTDVVLSYLLNMNETIICNYLRECKLMKVIGLKIYNFEYIRDYIDYVTNVLLQLLVYRVIVQNDIDSLNVIKILSEKVDELNIKIEKQLNMKKNDWIIEKENKKSHLSAEFVSKCFSLYVTHRSKLYEEFNIKEILKEEMLNSPSLFEEVPAKYKAEKILIEDENNNLIQSIITEDQPIDKYKSKLKITKSFIDIMHRYGSRDCYSSCLQDLKVYFREIFVSKSSYKRRMASRIVNEYIKQVSSAEQENQPIPKFDKSIYVCERKNNKRVF